MEVLHQSKLVVNGKAMSEITGPGTVVNILVTAVVGVGVSVSEGKLLTLL